MNRRNVEPPEGVPEVVAKALTGSDDGQLREIIQYAQRLLAERPPLTDAIEAREGEELLRTEDHGEYTIAIVERLEATGKARGPFAYRVTWDSSIDGEDGKYRWHYLGRVDEGGGA